MERRQFLTLLGLELAGSACSIFPASDSPGRRARKLVLVASGKTKAKAIGQAVEGPVTSMVTASALQLHRDATVIVDEQSAAGLTMRDYYEFIYAAKPAAPKS